MEIRGEFVNTSFKFSGNIPEELNSFVDNNELFNQSGLLFLEEKYMDECKRFSKIVDKLKIKTFNSDLIFYENNELKKVEDFSQEVKLIRQVIYENNINGLQKKDLCISINHFEIYKNSKKIEFIQSIYILLFLSNITEYAENILTFKVKIGDKELAERVFFDEIEKFNLFKFYSWIITSKENIQTRLRIVREIIIRKSSFKLTDEDLYSAKSAFNRIIKEETDNYFAQVNLLKDDFLKLSERQRKSYESLHLKFLGWGSSIALFMYGEIKDKPSGNLWQKILFSKTEKSCIFISIFLVSLLTIWILFKKEMNDNDKEYEKIKLFYTKQLFFDENDFSNFIEGPKISCLYNIIFWILFGLLLIRLLSFRLVLT
ncbi:MULTISPECIES: hypothetical protein [Bacteria]|uniref:hypothetical protein n=1 Tax=Bacteria TaxID=2 RepID=UPI001C49A4D3|nr:MULTISPECIES: hypothetical protein [Enterococcus]